MPNQTVSIREDISIGSTAFTFTVTDPRSLTLSYSISDTPPPPDEFQLDSVTGELTVARELDYETTPRYEFRIMVENTNGQPDRLTVVVELTNVDDNPTVCSESAVFFSVIEEQSIVNLQLPVCTDDDMPTNPSFDYSLSVGNETGLFLINGGNISLLRSLDYEVQTLHHLSINIVQLGGSLSFTMTAIIEVISINEHTPQFTSTTIDLTVQESALIASSVGLISATDDDAGSDGMVIYTISSQSSNKFTIHPSTGEVIVTRSLDFETAQSFSFSVVATDSPADHSTQRSSTAQVQISIQDVNDNRPRFMSYVYYTGVSERSYSVGRQVAHLPCNDLDSGVNQELTYFIAAGNEEGKFRINATSGQIDLVSALNYEDNATQFYNLTIECQEVRPPRRKDQSSLLVSVESFNEFFPDPGANYMATVSEDTPIGTSILRVQGRDRDRGPAGMLTYYINEDNTQYCPHSIVYIDRFTGVIYLNSPLDYEAGLRTIYCTVLVWDSELPLRPAEADLIITVTNANDALPVCNPPCFNATVSEDSPIGHEVLTLTCSDDDSPMLQYSILEASIPFQVSSSGILTVSSNLDYEAHTSYRIPIEVSDGEFSFNTTVFVSILGTNEHTPVIAQAMYTCSMYENEAVGFSVCTVSARDNDSGLDGTINYQISSGTLSNAFAVDQESGRIFLARTVDYESERSFSLLIEAYDLGEPSLTSSVSVVVNVADLNDNQPQMDSLSFFTVSENAAVGEEVGTLVCNDSDAGNNAQVNFQLNSIVEVNTNGTETLVASTPFALDSTTGALTVSSNLDYETNWLYRLSIVCRDNGTPSLATFSMVSILLLAENEYTPSFSQPDYSVYVSENTTIGTSVLVVSATDDDDGAQGDIIFSIQTSNSQPFSINPQLGVISLTAQLDCLQNVAYVLTIVARDGGGPPMQSQVNVAVNIIGCHLGSLVPQRSVYVGSVEENSPAGTAILAVTCDSIRTSLPSSYSPSYRISRDDSNLFRVDENSGQLSISSPPDLEAGASHFIDLQCFDENNPEVTSNFSAYVSVTPVNENDPEFSEDPYMFSVEEDRPLGSVVFTVEASDLDSGRDGEVMYSISGDDSRYFFIDPHTGEVYLTETLDRESRNELTLILSAYDNPEDVTSRRSSVSTINIQVTDSNDHWPQCNRTVFHLVVSPRTEPGSTILSNLECFDVDLGLNGELEYVLGDGDDESREMFSVDRNEGRLTLIDTLDPEDSISHHVPITVQDLGTPSLSVSVLVVIDVQEPSLSRDISTDDRDRLSLLEAEGLKNAVNITLNDISFNLVSELIPCK